MLRIRAFFALLALACALSLAAVDIADARIGGGSSFGSRGSRTFSAPPATRTAPSGAAPIQRSITQPSAPGAPRPYAPGGGLFGRPGFFGGGFLGGLAAGFLGAGLFGLLFGGSLFGGLGGFASLIGLLLQVALVVIVARMLFAWWQRRNAPAFAARMPGASGMDTSSYQHGGGYGSLPGSAAPGNAIAIGKDDYDSFEKLLGEIQSAYGREDLAALRSRVTPEMLSYFGEDLAKNASRGVVNHLSEVKLLQGDLAEAWSEGDTEYATVALRFSLVDVMVDRLGGKVVEGSEQPTEVTELWTFLRNRGGRWILSAIQQT
jgi:predicted lipid-binding transport protein (Tim44 family)